VIADAAPTVKGASSGAIATTVAIAEMAIRRRLWVDLDTETPFGIATYPPLCRLRGHRRRAPKITFAVLRPEGRRHFDIGPMPSGVDVVSRAPEPVCPTVHDVEFEPHTSAEVEPSGARIGGSHVTSVVRGPGPRTEGRRPLLPGSTAARGALFAIATTSASDLTKL
jgi:hypothetical protein